MGGTRNAAWGRAYHFSRPRFFDVREREGGTVKQGRAMPEKTRYIDVCRGEIRIALHADGKATISGGATDPDKQRYQAVDGLRRKIGWLNEQLADCIAATDALGRRVA